MSLFPRLTRSHPSNPANWLLYGLSGGTQSNAGVNVTEDTALSLTPIWSAVTQFAQDFAALPRRVHKIIPRGKEAATNHRLYYTIHKQVNPHTSSFSFFEFMAGQVVLYGDSFSRIVLHENGVINLYPLLASKMLVDIIENEKIFAYITDNKTYIYPQEQILHVPGFSKNGITGVRPILNARESVGLSIALETYAATFFGQGAKPSVVLQHPQTLGKAAKDNLRKSWTEMHTGLENSHKAAILEEGMTLKEYGVSPEDAQALESRKFSIDEAARLTNMPPHRLKNLERATFSNIEHQDIEYVKYTMLPFVVRVEQALNTQLFSEAEQKKYFIGHNMNGLLRGDTESRNKAYATGRQWGWLSANDVREMDDKNPIEGGDVYLQPMNMFDANTDPAILPQTKSIRESRSVNRREKIERQFAPLLKQLAQKVVNRESIAVGRILKKELKSTRQSNDDIKTAIENIYNDIPDYIKNEMGPAFHTYAESMRQAAADEINFSGDITKDLKQFVDEYIDNFSQRHVNSSRGALLYKLDNDGIDEAYNLSQEWPEDKAEQISDNEVNRCGNAVTRFVWIAGGVAYLRWKARGSKSCKFCQSLDGKITGIHKPFLSPGDFNPKGAESPLKIRNNKFHPPIHRGCVCTILPG